MIIPPSEITKILYINIAHIGDIVLSLPVTRALKTTYPAATIDMLVNSPQGEAALYNPYVNKVLYYNIRTWRQDGGKLRQLIACVAKENYDLAVATCYGTVDPMLAYLSGARFRAGYAQNGGARFLTHVVPSDGRPQHEVDYLLEVARILGIKAECTTIEYCIPPYVKAVLYEKISSLTDRSRPKVVICPFSQEEKKSWDITQAATVLRKLPPSAHCYLIGSREQLAGLQKINEAADSRGTILAGTLSLGELGALIEDADLLITIDTGPMHIAQAFTTPVIALFGPTDPNCWGPRRPYDIVLRADVPCSPCTIEVSHSCASARCMSEITAADVLEAADTLLKPLLS